MPTRLQGPSRTARAIATVAALLMVAALLFLLRGGRLGPPRPASATVSVLVLPSPVVPQIPEVARPPVSRERTPLRPAPQARPQSTPQDTPPASASPSPPTPLAITVPPDRPASAPLDLGTRSAIARSKGSTRQMAEASGQVLDTPKTTAAQQLAGGIEQAGIEGCLSEGATKHEHPALAMGGLLAAPGLVVAALSGRCKP